MLKGGELLLELAETMRWPNVEIDIVTWPEQLPVRVREILGVQPGQSISRDLGPWMLICA